MTGSDSEPRLEPIPHPLVDRIRDTWVQVESRAPVLFLGAAQADLLVSTAAAGKRAIFVTDELSALTLAFREALSDHGGAWVVRSADHSLRDGLTGRKLSTLTEAINGSRIASAHEIAPAFLRPRAAQQLEIVTTVSFRHRADISTQIGGTVELITRALQGEPPAAWDVIEPITEDWNRAEMTEFCRKRMPHDTRIIVRGQPTNPSISTVRVARTRHGLEETTRSYALVGELGSAGATAALSAIPELLISIANSGMPLLCLVLARPRDDNQLTYPVISPPPRPLALMVGPPGVHALKIDVERAVREQGAVVVGRPRLPGLMFRLGTFDEPGADRLRAVLESFDPTLLAEAMGHEAPLYRGETS
ncbi:MAG: DUF6177 family protein [Rhodoglobus sp.]